MYVKKKEDICNIYLYFVEFCFIIYFKERIDLCYGFFKFVLIFILFIKLLKEIEIYDLFVWI